MTRAAKTMLAAAAGVLMLAAACSDPTVPPAPSTAPATIPEIFTGTLNVLSTNTHNFTVQQVGAIQVTLTDVEPPAAISIGIGTPSVAGCLVIAGNTGVAGTTTLLSGTATIAGNFCVSVSDVGNLVEPVNYTVSVIHS